MSYTITKKQIHQLLPTISSTGEDLLKTWFPGAFKFTSGWYKHKSGGHKNWLMFLDSETQTGYGFNTVGEWIRNWANRGYVEHNCQPATEEEVKYALVKEAEKRYAGNKFTSINPHVDKEPVDTNFYNWYFSFTENKLYTQKHLRGGKLAFQNGKWAEIIKPELPKSVTDWISQLGKDEAIRLINETQRE